LVQNATRPPTGVWLAEMTSSLQRRHRRLRGEIDEEAKLGTSGTPAPCGNLGSRSWAEMYVAGAPTPGGCSKSIHPAGRFHANDWAECMAATWMGLIG
jgi:hypothetical protein